MFNSDSKKAAIKRLEDAAKQHETISRETREKAGALHQLRIESAHHVIGEAERYYSALANAPKEFEKTVGEYRVAFERFNGLVAETRERAENATALSGSVAGAGTLVGIGVAAFGPTAAIAVATTFGAASTGTAIASLSGAVAADAALAWLGGGALAAGGGGIAAGEALLALAGPIGWGIGIVALGGAGWYHSKKNAEVAVEATARAEDVEGRVRSLVAANLEIDRLIDLTRKHASGTVDAIARLLREAPRDYRAFTREQKEELGALKNNIESLSVLLTKTASVK